MARITDPDSLNQNVEVTFITGSKTIQLDSSSGNLDADGVTLQALYSFTKEEWRTDSNLIKYQFPFISITEEQFELINGWDFADQTSKELIRDGGWAKKNNDGSSNQEYMNITSLGAFDDSLNDQAYYLQVDGGTPTDVVFNGEVNLAIQIFEEGSFDYRTFFKIYLREQGKTYGFYDLIQEQNISALTYKKFALPLTNASDLKITSNDALIATGSPWVSMSISYEDLPVTRSIGGEDRYFSIVIDGNSGTAEQIYEFVQYSLRQPTDIDSGSGTVRGDTAEELLTFIGDTLRTLQISTGEGAYIDNFLAADTNRLEFTDDGGTVRRFPFVASGEIQFNDNLQNDSSASYFVFFTNDDDGDNTGRDFGTGDAIIINDNSGNPITGSVNAAASVEFDFDYDNNIQRGNASSGSDAPFTAVALGLNTAQYVVTNGSITRTTSNVINFVAALERNYSNPA